MAEAQKAGGVAAFIDAEHAFDRFYAQAVGVDVDNLLISQPDNGEQALSIADQLIRSAAIDVVVIDSVAALTPKKEIEGTMGDSAVGLQARLMSQALRKLTSEIAKTNTTCIFINQLREKIGVMFGNPETTTGGNALKFYASVRLDLNDVNYHIPLPEQEGGSCDYIAFADTQTVAFKTTRPERMVYTLDGTMPTPESATYDKPFHFNSSQLLKIATVLPTGKMSRVRTIHIERQIPSPAVPMAAGQTPKPGLSVKLAWGTYKYTEELAAVEQWQHKTIAKLSELNELTEVSKNRRNIRNYAAIAEGLIDVPQDGAYYFQANFPEVWIDGRKVVDNNHEPISHHYAGGRSIVLKAGKHRLQIYFLGHTVDGYSSYGSATDNLKYRLGAVGSFSNVDDAWLSQL